MLPPVPAGSFLLTALCCTACASTPSSVPIYQPKIIQRYTHDTGAFTQGLTYLGQGKLLESTGLVGQSGIRMTELKTGRVLKQKALPIAEAFGEGSTQFEGKIYYFTWQHQTAFVFDAQTWQELDRLEYQNEGWGLTHDGQHLIASDGSSKLTWRDPKTFVPLRQLTVTVKGEPLKYINELEYIQGSVYANIWMTNKIARIDPKSGKVMAWVDLNQLSKEVQKIAAQKGQTLTRDDVLNGIAFIPERGTLLLTGKRWPMLFEVEVPPLGFVQKKSK